MKLRGPFALPVPLDDVVAAARLFPQLPGYFRHPMQPEEARPVLRGWLDTRESDFLNLVRDAIYVHPDNPYRQMLALAGCEMGDLQRLVATDGLEGALASLFRLGVYLTVDEFKGRRPAVRGSATIEVRSSLLRSSEVTATGNQSAGSRGARTMAHFGIRHLRNRAVANAVYFDARGGLGWVKGIWDVPGSGVGNALRYSGFSTPIARWFSLVDAGMPGLDPRYRWAERAVYWGGLLGGVRLPRPEAAPMDQPLPIARWLAQVLASGQAPHLYGFVSPIVRLCHAAQARGIDIAGTQFSVTGEPLTPARLGVIRRSGATALSRYGTAEAGAIGWGCVDTSLSEELHLMTDRIALVQAGELGPARGLPRDTLLVSSLRAGSPFVLLNLSLGDQGTLNNRDCGCPLQAIGWTTHLENPRSFEKLTAAGMTFLDTDVIKVLEEVLPARFGGGPTHYQLVEGEDADGRPSLRLLVHPVVGSLDEVAVAEAFLNAIEDGSGAERVMGEVWRTPGLLRVERRPPFAASGSKVHHIHRATSVRDGSDVRAVDRP